MIIIRFAKAIQKKSISKSNFNFITLHVIALRKDEAIA
jgi:hypothetical protein